MRKVTIRLTEAQLGYLKAKGGAVSATIRTMVEDHRREEQNAARCSAGQDYPASPTVTSKEYPGGIQFLVEGAGEPIFVPMATVERAREQLRGFHKIRAVKILRAETPKILRASPPKANHGVVPHLGLRWALAIANHLQKGLHPAEETEPAEVDPDTVECRTFANFKGTFKVPVTLIEELLEPLLLDNKYIQAIKELRANSILGLTEAKAIVDVLREESRRKGALSR